MTTYLDRLKSINACDGAVNWCAEHHPTDCRAVMESSACACWVAP